MNKIELSNNYASAEYSIYITKISNFVITFRVCPLYSFTELAIWVFIIFFVELLFSEAASIKYLNIGAGSHGLDLNSGWNCEATK